MLKNNLFKENIYINITRVTTDVDKQLKLLASLISLMMDKDRDCLSLKQDSVIDINYTLIMRMLDVAMGKTIGIKKSNKLLGVECVSSSNNIALTVEASRILGDIVDEYLDASKDYSSSLSYIHLKDFNDLIKSATMKDD